MELILASMSPYRKWQLRNLGYAFSVIPAHIDESRLPGEMPRDLALRLAREKARRVHQIHGDAVIVGSDQIGVYQDKILTKPGSREKALEHLNTYSGGVVTFETAIAVRGTDETEFFDVVSTTIGFRRFTTLEAEAYVDMDEPYDCAGAIKSEKHGPLLFEWVRSDDPSALVGLPLIRTAEFLRRLGINPLTTIAPNTL